MSGQIEQAVRVKFGKFKKSKGKHGLEYVVRCPFCHKPDKMYLNPTQGVYICFRCGETGGVQELLGQIDELNKVPVQLAYSPMPEHVDAPGDLVTLHELASDHPAIRYIRRRNFDPAELNDTFGVRYCVRGKTYAHRYDTTNTLIFPMWMSGKLVGWQSRLLYTPDELTEEECQALNLPKDEDGDWVKPPKYWTSPGLPKGQILFNYDWASKSEVAVLCEGTFDAMSVGRSGVAALGKGVTDYQVKLLMTHPHWKVIVLLLDPGDADLQQQELAFKLSRVSHVLVTLKGYKDAGEAPRKEIWAQIGEAAFKQGINLFNYTILL